MDRVHPSSEAVLESAKTLAGGQETLSLQNVRAGVTGTPKCAASRRRSMISPNANQGGRSNMRGGAIPP